MPPQTLVFVSYSPQVMQWLAPTRNSVSVGGVANASSTTSSKSYVIFDRTNDTGPPTRVPRLNLTLASHCQHTVSGRTLVVDDRGTV